MKKELRQLITGILLGDAHIKRIGSDKAHITFEQSTKKQDYINHVYELVKKEGLAIKNEQLTTYDRFDARYGSVNSSYYFKSENLSELREFADLFLNENNQKVIPTNIANHLTHRSLAF